MNTSGFWFKFLPRNNRQGLPSPLVNGLNIHCFVSLGKYISTLRGLTGPKAKSEEPSDQDVHIFLEERKSGLADLFFLVGDPTCSTDRLNHIRLQSDRPKARVDFVGLLITLYRIYSFE